MKRTLFALLANLAVWSVVVGQSLHWPTDASRLLSSSFCEYRPGRFHAGIDIKTGGAVGYKVFAVRPGYVSRVHVSPFGYGRVLYLVLDTGETAVYAHLQRFMDSIEERVYAEQEKRGRFSVDLYFRPSEFPVQQGQVIAYTGQSGAKAPHLHFELRDRYNCPVNPLLFGFQVQDTRPPVIRRVAFVPMDVNSRVQNDLAPLIRPAKVLNGHRFVLEESVQVWGRVGIAVSCYDQADGAENRFAVYALRLLVDGKEAFRSEYQRFCYEQNRQMLLDREFRLEARGHGDFQRLFRDPNNSLRFYRSRFRSSGILLAGVSEDPSDLCLAVGSHRVTIEASDYAGNVATLSFSLLVTAPGGPVPVLAAAPASKEALVAEADLGEVQFEGPEPGDTSLPFVTFAMQVDSMETEPQSLGLRHRAGRAGRQELVIDHDFYDDYVRLCIRAPRRLIDPPRVVAWHGSEKYSELSSWDIGLGTYVAGLPLDVGLKKSLHVEAVAADAKGDTLLGISSLQLFPITPERGGVVRSADGLSEVRFEGGAVYRPLYARVAEVPLTPTRRAPVVGKAYRFEPNDVPLKGTARLTISLTEPEPRPEQLAIYSVSPKGALAYVGRQGEPQGKQVRCTINRLGTFAVVRDSVPPVIASLQPAVGATLATDRPTLRVEFHDALSGIGGEEAIELLLDGRRVIAEYDPPRRCAFYVPRQPVARGAHRVTATVRDRCGNASTVEHRFFIR
ncbi:MAG: M23 family metallopeptidase [Calditrichaeota bacterium]|nr:M23 family metallopeptidase [Calditrichota bacterium]